MIKDVMCGAGMVLVAWAITLLGLFIFAWFLDRR